MPTQQRGRREDQSPCRQSSTERSKDAPICWQQLRPFDLPPEDCNLMAKSEDLEIALCIRAPAQDNQIDREADQHTAYRGTRGARAGKVAGMCLLLRAWECCQATAALTPRLDRVIARRYFCAPHPQPSGFPSATRPPDRSSTSYTALATDAVAPAGPRR